MKTHLLSLLLFGFVAAAPASLFSATESFSRSAPFDPTGKVSLHNVNGDVTVETWDRNEIAIEGEKNARTEEELKRIDLAIELLPEQANIRVRLPKNPKGIFGGKSVRGGVRFTLRIPATATLSSIETVNGSVTISAVSGRVDAKTVNGRIETRDLQGDASLETVNGSIATKFSRVSSHQEIALKTVNGSIDVSLPPDAGLKVRSSVVNGRISSDFPIDRATSREKKKLHGTIGDGRAALQAESVNGSIELAKL
ncbi:MAG TPA: DUF4097 family beta strand repeat-containing protein [Opitutus sp.]|nr:DUF4097 family beta strand repeat-containing protein [Opitutus sp.]